MAKTNIPIFAVGTYDSIMPAISSGTLTYPAYIFCTDTNTMVFIDKHLKMQNLKGYDQESIITVDSLPESDIRSDAFYICNGIGHLYINGIFVPVFQDINTTESMIDEKISAISYNNLADIPIVNKYGEVGAGLVLADLSNGSYSISGQYQVGGTISTTYITARKTIFLIDSDDTNKYITKFGTGEILLYTINLETGDGKTESYATQGWIQKQGYTTENYVTEAINAMYQKIIAELSVTKVSQLENDAGYLTAKDINGIGNSDIVNLF